MGRLCSLVRALSRSALRSDAKATIAIFDFVHAIIFSAFARKIQGEQTNDATTGGFVQR
jgi:hypothetical protein